MLSILFLIKKECIAINNFDILSNVDNNQRIVSCDHDTLQGDSKEELQLFYYDKFLTLGDGPAKTLSACTVSCLSGQWKARKPANRKLVSTYFQAR